MSQDIKNRIGQNIKYYRELHNHTREQLSLLLGFENSYIAKVEKGRMNITLERLCVIAEFFNIEVDELFH